MKGRITMSSSDMSDQTPSGVAMHDVPFTTWFGLARHVTVVGIASAVTGLLVGGIGSRVFMRIAGAVAGSQGSGRTTEAGFIVGDVTVFGTVFFVIFMAIATGAFGAVAYLVLRPWLSWAGRFRGLLFGIALFALASATSDMMNPDNRDFLILGNELILVLLIAALFVAFGVTLDLFVPRADRWFPSGSEAERTGGVAFAALAGLGLMIAVPLMVITLLGGEGACHCETPVWAVRSFILVAVSTIVMWLAAIVRVPTWVIRIATTAGVLGVVGVFVFGLMRAISDAADIIG
jgi:hypothetical protein